MTITSGWKISLWKFLVQDQEWKLNDVISKQPLDCSYSKNCLFFYFTWNFKLSLHDFFSLKILQSRKFKQYRIFSNYSHISKHFLLLVPQQCFYLNQTLACFIVFFLPLFAPPIPWENNSTFFAHFIIVIFFLNCFVLSYEVTAIIK